MGDAPTQVPPFIPQTIKCSQTGATYTLGRPMTDYRKCFDGLPVEARILFTCQRADTGDEYIVKVKVQVPAGNKVSDEETQPDPGPSTTTAAEIKALQIFRENGFKYAPHLIVFETIKQGDDGPLPGGYITYTIMTRIPGRSAYDLRYWDQEPQERERILKEFKVALRTIIDFELWREATEYVPDETKEMQRWGLLRRAPPRDWWAEWNHQWR